jgi:hypothetical protein
MRRRACDHGVILTAVKRAWPPADARHARALTLVNDARPARRRMFRGRIAAPFGSVRDPASGGAARQLLEASWTRSMSNAT